MKGSAKILIFGTESVLALARVRELKLTLEKAGHAVRLEFNPKKLKEASVRVDWAILAVTSLPPPLTPWQAYFTSLSKRPFFAALCEKELPSQIIKELNPDPIIYAGDNFQKLLSAIQPEQLDMTNRNKTILADDSDRELNEPAGSGAEITAVDADSFIQQDIDHTVPLSVAANNDEVSVVLDVLQADHKPEDLPLTPTSTPPSKELPPVSEDFSLEVDFSESNAEPKVDAVAPDLNEWEPQLDKPVAHNEHAHAEENLGDFDLSLSVDAGHEAPAEAILAESLDAGLMIEGLSAPTSHLESAASESALAVDAAVNEAVDWDIPVASQVHSQVDLKASHGEDLGPQDLSFVQEPAENHLAASEPAETSAHISPAHSEDVAVLRRFSTLKDREAREKEATIQVIKRQLAQVQARLAASDGERRRLTMSLQENQTLLRTLKDGRDQDKHHIGKLESQHQEELRSLQLRLDNAQFQASKAEKKLEEFRDRVRNDIQKIRVRERELANRLELQKRDAEALLAAKDERLLQQKREIDRLEFEIETQQERLLEETQKAEERAGRLMRALQSLRLAEGMLSGIEEEVLPNSGNGEGEAA